MVTKLSGSGQLTRYAAERYDSGQRCDMEAGTSRSPPRSMEIAPNARIHGGLRLSTYDAGTAVKGHQREPAQRDSRTTGWPGADILALRGQAGPRQHRSHRGIFDQPTLCVASRCRCAAAVLRLNAIDLGHLEVRGPATRLNSSRWRTDRWHRRSRRSETAAMAR